MTKKIVVIIICAILIIPLNIYAITNTETEATQAMTDIGGKILGLIQAIGTILSVIMVMIIGIKYMLSSAEEKAASKKK